MQEALNVLVFGSGAREHAIAEAISDSPLLDKLFLADAGFAKLGEVIDYSDFEDLAKKCVKEEIKLVIIGPEQPICDGIVDVFNAHNISCIGVNKSFSQLESSKLYAKKFMEKHSVKTAKYSIVTAEKLPNYAKINYPVVIKADGLCGGKGVVTAHNKAFAEKTIAEYLDGKFGDNSKTILLEEFLDGPELSLMSLWDGKTLLNFAPSRDFKKLNKSPSAPNTGGMGAFCPVSLSEVQNKKLEEYKKQLQNALEKEKIDCVGFIYSGLIWAKDDWYVLEYNVRMGDPETQALLTHLDTDFLSILTAAINKELDKIKLRYKGGYSACLVIASQGYPKNPQVGEKVVFDAPYGIKVFYAGVKEVNGELFSDGGRVLSLCTTGDNPFTLLRHYAKKVNMKNKYYRDDIDI